MNKIMYYNNIDQVRGLPEETRKQLSKVGERYQFKANDHYLSLIDWDDPDDPIRRVVIPHIDELDSGGELDPSCEESNYVAPGLQHKYFDTVLLLCSETCGAYCRFCFRKRLFQNDAEVVHEDFSGVIEYIKENRQLRNILVSGGDPLMLPTKRLESILTQLKSIEHIKTIRIGSKMLAFNPYRILDDQSLIQMLSRNSTAERRLWLITHFSVAKEITDSSIEAIDQLLSAGLILSNQTPMLAGVNDNPETMAELFNKLVAVGIPPYYVFQCRPTAGNQSFAVPISRGYEILQEAGKRISGMAKRARFVMSHASGKIEIVGLTKEHIYMKYHRARNPQDESRFMIFKRDDRACWMEDLEEVSDSVSVPEVFQEREG